MSRIREIPSFPRSLEEAQPQHVEAFDTAFRAEGGRFVKQDDLLQWYRLRYWYYVQTFRNSPLHRPYLDRFHFDLVANEHLNAAATRQGSTYLIGLNVGTIMNLEAFFSLLLSHPRVLPEIGQPSREVPWIASLAACDWRLPWASALTGATLRGQPPESFPIDGVRKVYAHRLAILATDFVFFHELGHLANGHLEYLEAEGKPVGMKELAHGDLSLKDALDQQALEINADSHAVLVMTPDWFRVPEQLPATHAFETVTEAIESLALAVISVFLLFDPHPTRVDEYDRTAHPHPAVRLFNVGLMTWSAAERANPRSVKRVQAAWLRGLERAEAICATANVGAALWSAVDAEMETVNAEYQRVASHFQTVDRNLRPDVRGRHK